MRKMFFDTFNSKPPDRIWRILTVSIVSVLMLLGMGLYFYFLVYQLLLSLSGASIGYIIAIVIGEIFIIPIGLFILFWVLLSMITMYADVF